MKEFVEQFLVECRELVEQATDDLLALEDNPADRERLDSAFRAFHTLKGAAGQCFSVEPNSAALTSPVDAGIYCYDADGTLTAAALALGTLTLTGAPAPAPPAITLPAPVVAGTPLPTTSPSPTAPASAGTQ